MNRNKIKELVPEGTRDVSGNLVDIDEVNMDYGGYRMKVKAGGSIGDFYVNGPAKPTTTAASTSIPTRIPSRPIPTRGSTAATPKRASAWDGTTSSPTRAYRSAC